MSEPTTSTDGRIRRGDQTRRTVLRRAVDLASVEGLDGVTIGRLAQELSISKSGLFAHFGSKEELQLATIEAASALYDEQVVDPALAAATGIERLNALVDNFMRHVEENVYPGGCFFASVIPELDTHPGAVRDSALAFMGSWLGHIEKAIRDAQEEGAIDPAEDAEQLLFEVEAAMMLANAMFVIAQEATPIVRARRAITRRLADAAPKAA